MAAIGFSAIHPYTSVLNSRGGGGKNMNALGRPAPAPQLSLESVLQIPLASIVS